MQSIFIRKVLKKMIESALLKSILEAFSRSRRSSAWRRKAQLGLRPSYRPHILDSLEPKRRGRLFAPWHPGCTAASTPLKPVSDPNYALVPSKSLKKLQCLQTCAGRHLISLLQGSPSLILPQSHHHITLQDIVIAYIYICYIYAPPGTYRGTICIYIYICIIPLVYT